MSHRRNTGNFERCDLVPNILRGAATFDTSVNVLGQKPDVPFGSGRDNQKPTQNQA